jgi:hypothetical protein
MAVIISKTDIFTKNYNDAEILWKRLANNFRKVHFVNTNSHYFQTDRSLFVANVLINIIANK